MANKFEKRIIQVCSECGSPKVQTKMWVEYNTDIPQDSCSDGEDQDNWCPECESHTSFKSKRVAIVPEKKSYIIVDSENKWHSTGVNASPKEIANDIKEVKDRLKEEGISGIKLFVYETIGEPLEIKI